MNFEEWWETLPPHRPNRPRKVAREAWEAALEEAALRCERTAAAYRAMKVNQETGEPAEDAAESEEMAYCSELNAKAIRSMKAT